MDNPTGDVVGHIALGPKYDVAAVFSLYDFPSNCPDNIIGTVSVPVGEHEGAVSWLLTARIRYDTTGDPSPWAKDLKTSVALKVDNLTREEVQISLRSNLNFITTMLNAKLEVYTPPTFCEAVPDLQFMEIVNWMITESELDVSMGTLDPKTGEKTHMTVKMANAMQQDLNAKRAERSKHEGKGEG